MNSTTPTPTAFFSDTRAIAEKLETDKRDWIPAKNADDPKKIFGLVLERGTYTSTLDDRVHPTMRLLSSENIEWSIIGFHGYLRSELERKNPQPSDFVAVAYRGTKPARKAGESDAHVYALEVERNPGGDAASALIGEPEDAGPPDDDVLFSDARA